MEKYTLIDIIFIVVGIVSCLYLIYFASMRIINRNIKKTIDYRLKGIGSK
jgi:uncharacterized protein YneF (UPF0154 family)